MNAPVKSNLQIAPLPNVLLFRELTHALLNRTPGLPGFGTFYGPSGFGKSHAATSVYMRTRCPLIELGDDTTKKSLFKAILRELAVPFRDSASLPDLVNLVVDEFQSQDQPLLIIDEADYLVSKRMIEIVRTILNRVPHLSIILIGEECLPNNLETWERVAGRILFNQAAQPCTLQDAHGLAPIYAPELEISGDLIEEIVSLSEGSARRVSTNLVLVNHIANNNALDAIDLKTFRDLSPQDLHESTPPKPRSFGGVSR